MGLGMRLRNAGIRRTFLLAIEHPAAGTWTLAVQGTGIVPSSYAVILRSEGPAEQRAHLEIMTRDSNPALSFLAAPGDPVFVRVYVTKGSEVIRGVRWFVLGTTTPSGFKLTIPVFDDGRHADGAADDGISVGGVVAEGPDGFYELAAKAFRTRSSAGCGRWMRSGTRSGARRERDASSPAGKLGGRAK